MTLPIPPGLLAELPLSGASPATSLWQHKTANIFRGVLELDCSDRSAAEISDLVLRTVKLEYDPGMIVPFAFGTVLRTRAAAPDERELEQLVDDRSRNRGTWQWIVLVHEPANKALGIHMWASGYLTPVFDAILSDLERQGFACTRRVKPPSRFWTRLWATGKVLVTAQRLLVSLGIFLAAVIAVMQACSGK